jgi:hypothetical protein
MEIASIPAQCRARQRNGDPHRDLSFVIAGHSRPKDGVASLAYDPAIHDEFQQSQM